MKYVRAYVPGGTYFFTVVTQNRRPIFTSTQAIETLRDSFRFTRQRYPFEIIACVILPDHMHFIWTLPPDSSDFSIRWRIIKTQFSMRWMKKSNFFVSISRAKKGETGVWQRRFWEQLIRDDTDLSNHIAYIHYNPVKHGYVEWPSEWKYSSFMKFVREGYYPENWGINEKIDLSIMDVE